MNTKGLEGIYVERSSADNASYKPKLNSEATGNQIIEAFRSAISQFNVGKKVARSYLASPMKFRTGDLELVVENTSNQDAVCLGTKGDYPSANMVLLAITGSGERKEIQRILDRERKYSKGTEFCLVHAQWNNYSWKHDIPMIEDCYQLVRKHLAEKLNEELSQQGV